MGLGGQGRLAVSDILGSILGSALKGLAGQAMAGGGGGIARILAQVLGNTDLGSVGGLLQRLMQSGLGGQVASWLGKGNNLPVSADELRNALGDDTIAQLARQFNMPADELLRHLSEHLPGTIDGMSPNGSVEHHADASAENADDGDDDDGDADSPGRPAGRAAQNRRLSDLGPD